MQNDLRRQTEMLTNAMQSDAPRDLSYKSDAGAADARKRNQAWAMAAADS